MQAVDMYAAAGKWSAAHKVAMGFLPEAEVHVSGVIDQCVHFQNLLFAQM